MINWWWDNPHSFRDQDDNSYPESTNSGKVIHTGECFSLYSSNPSRAKIEPPNCLQYRSGNLLAIRPLNLDKLLDEDDDAENCVPR